MLCPELIDSRNTNAHVTRVFPMELPLYRNQLIVYEAIQRILQLALAVRLECHDLFRGPSFDCIQTLACNLRAKNVL